MCSHLKCRIFTTVGTPQKRRFIRENFPHVSADEAQARRGGASYLRALAEIAHPTYCTYVRTYVVRVHLHVPAYEYTYGYKYTNTTSTIFYHTAILVDTCVRVRSTRNVYVYVYVYAYVHVRARARARTMSLLDRVRVFRADPGQPYRRFAKHLVRIHGHEGDGWQRRRSGTEFASRGKTTSFRSMFGSRRTIFGNRSLRPGYE